MVAGVRNCMPIHLAALTRRDFLRRSLTAAAGAFLGSELLVSAKETDPDTWALISDTHLAADPETTAHGINMASHFRTVARDITGLPKRPAGLFLTGDCAYN